MELQNKKGSVTYSLADQCFARAKSVGIFNVSMDLLHTLARRSQAPPLTVLANSTLRENLALPPSAQTVYHDTALRGKFGRMWWDQVGVYGAAHRTGNEWLLLPKGFASFARRCPVRLAPLVHDVLQDHYDRHYPNEVSKAEMAYFRASLRASLQQADVIFTPTEFTSREIRRMAGERGWPVPPLVCCGEGFECPAQKPATARRDIFVLASRFPYKLTRQAVEFFSRWIQESSFQESVHWVGSLPPGLTTPSIPQFRWHPRLPEKEFRELMDASRVIVFTSEYEGFGRPPVEAVLAGACPVYSDIPATREVMNGAGCPFTNGDYPSFATAVQRAISVTPAEIDIWSEELIGRHNWDSVVDRILGALGKSREELCRDSRPTLAD